MNERHVCGGLIGGLWLKNPSSWLSSIFLLAFSSNFNSNRSVSTSIVFIIEWWISILLVLVLILVICCRFISFFVSSSSSSSSSSTASIYAAAALSSFTIPLNLSAADASSLFICSLFLRVRRVDPSTPLSHLAPSSSIVDMSAVKSLALPYISTISSIVAKALISIVTASGDISFHCCSDHSCSNSHYSWPSHSVAGRYMSSETRSVAHHEAL